MSLENNGIENRLNLLLSGFILVLGMLFAQFLFLLAIVFSSGPLFLMSILVLAVGTIVAVMHYFRKRMKKDKGKQPAPTKTKEGMEVYE